MRKDKADQALGNTALSYSMSRNVDIIKGTTGKGKVLSLVEREDGERSGQHDQA